MKFTGTGTFGGIMPDITKAQLFAVLGWVAAQGVAYGWLPKEYQQLAVSTGATLLAVVWKVADAHIRHGRATAAGPAIGNLVDTLDHKRTSVAAVVATPPPTVATTASK